MPPPEPSVQPRKGDNPGVRSPFRPSRLYRVRKDSRMAEPAVVARFSALPDEEIVSRVLAGETPLFEVLMRRHNERVYRAARAILRDEREAEDVMQEAYVNAYAHLAQFDGRAKFSTWLTKIAVYEALARARRRGRTEPMDDHALEAFMPITSSPD